MLNKIGCFAPVDIFPTICSLLNITEPNTIEGKDLSPALLNNETIQDAVLTMNFTASYDYFQNGAEWRGVRTKTFSYTKWLNGKIELYDIVNDSLTMNNLSGNKKYQEIEEELDRKLEELMSERNDKLVPCEEYRDWLDEQRNVIKNVYGEL